MACIYKRGGRYYLDYRANGKRVRKSVGTNKRLAELALKEVEVQLHKGILPAALPKKELATVIDEFLEFYKAAVKPNTFRQCKWVVLRFQKHLESIPFITLIQHVQPHHIEQYKMKRMQQRKPCTVNYDLKALNGLFGYAERLGYITENPVSKVKKVRVTQKRPRFFSKDELKRFFAACVEFEQAVFMTLLYTGMRKGELRNLEWEDIDFERQTIKIQEKDEWEPKGGKSREVPIHDEIYPILKRQEKRNGSVQWVFARKDGGRVSGIWQRFQRIATKAGIKRATVHTFRHTFASYMVMSGVDLPTVQKLLGHQNVKTTMIYAHLAQEHVRSAISKLRI